MTAALSPVIIDHPVQQIFNHDVMGCTAEGVSGNHLYSGRVLGATEPGDVIQLHPDLRVEWPWIRDHYQRIGLRHTHDVIWDLSHRVLSEHPDHRVSVFFFGEAEQRARPDDAWFRIVKTINCKNAFMDAAERLGVPIPLTRRYQAVADIRDTDIAVAPYPCYLKASISVSGVGIYRCADTREMCASIQRFAPETPVQIQQEVVTDIFLNLQYGIDDEGLFRHAATEQLLEGCVHQGNRYPASHEPWDQVEPMAQWLFDEGMRGVFAFDVAVVEHQGHSEYLAIECNPRFNGASYPTAVAKKLGVAQWLARTFGTRHRSLAEIDLSGIEYDPDTGRGVILINWGPILVGKILVLLAGDPAHQRALADALNTRL